MTLFPLESSTNLLPINGEVYYFNKIFDKQQSDTYLEKLLQEVAWQNDSAIIFGKHYITNRQVAWYATKEFSYTYSNITKRALLFTPLLLQLKNIVEQYTHSTYNSCLLNLYPSGKDGMAYHSDGEKMLEPNASIASLSFGAERKFLFKNIATNQTIAQVLEHGSLLEMKGTTQKFWKHRLPPTTKVHTPRVNLTFRKMLG